MDHEQEVIHKQMEETRSGLTDKLSALEAQVNTTVQSTTDAVQSTTDAVTGTVESVKETVENVSEKFHETVEGVTESVQQAVAGVKESVAETVRSVTETFNLKLQCERRPWMVFGGAVTVGCLGTILLSGSSRERVPSNKPEAPSLPSDDAREESRTRDNRSQPQAEQSPNSSHAGVEGWLWETLGSFKNLAVGAMMGVVRDLVSQAVPEKLKDRVSEEVDKLTESLGGEPIKGSLLPENQSTKTEPSTDQSPEQQPTRPTGLGRSEATAGRAGRPALTKNGR